jgi:acyltransferase-like protein
MSIKNISGRMLKRLSRETTSGRFIPELDGLRFVAIAMVILYHLNGYLIAKTTFYEHDATSDWLCRAALVGNHGVELFFVISGFILALPFAAHHLKQARPVSLRAYYLRRLTRLEPPYFATIFLLMLLSAVMTRTIALPLNGHLLASLFYMHNLMYGTFSPVPDAEICAGRSDHVVPRATSGIFRRTFTSAVTAFDPELLTVFSSRVPAGGLIPDRMGHGAKTHLLMGLHFHRRMADFVLYTPVFDSRSLGIPASAVCALRRSVPWRCQQSPALYAMDYRDRWHVLFHLSDSLRGNFGRGTCHEEVRRAVTDSGLSRLPICDGWGCHCSGMWHLFRPAGKTLHAERLATKGLELGR